MSKQAFTITVYDGSVSAAALAEVAALYREVYAEPPYLEGEDDFIDFSDGLPQRAKQENFRLVIARLGTSPLGFALGHQLSPTTHWWDGAVAPIPVDVTSEYPGRTFAVIELAVQEPFRRQQVGRRLHAHLMVDRAEERATLLVRPDATPALAAYVRWGYQRVGQIRPFVEAPVYDAMVSQ